MTDVRGLIGSVDALYERAVLTPDDIDDPQLAGWIEDLASGMEQPVDRQIAKLLRRAARTAKRLARIWSQRGPSSLPDWRNGVDDALGTRGWQVQFDLAKRGLEIEPSFELFQEASERYRAVHFTDWPVTYEDLGGER